MEFIYSKQAVKTIKHMDNSTKQRLKTAIERLPQGDTKRIKGREITTYRLRVGGWRILYSLSEDNIICIEKIAPRGSIYKEV